MELLFCKPAAFLYITHKIMITDILDNSKVARRFVFAKKNYAAIISGSLSRKSVWLTYFFLSFVALQNAFAASEA